MKIIKPTLHTLDELFQIYVNAKDTLVANNLFQWTDSYPNRGIIENDLKKDTLYALQIDNEIIGAIILNEEQDKEYQAINWLFDASKVLVIHRLVINPKHQKKGYATLLMNFAEEFAQQNSYSSIRLDAYSPNKAVIRFYQHRNYLIRGNIYFPERKHPFHCLEKKIEKLN